MHNRDDTSRDGWRVVRDDLPRTTDHGMIHPSCQGGKNHHAPHGAVTRVCRLEVTLHTEARGRPVFDSDPGLTKHRMSQNLF